MIRTGVTCGCVSQEEHYLSVSMDTFLPIYYGAMSYAISAGRVERIVIINRSCFDPDKHEAIELSATEDGLVVAVFIKNSRSNNFTTKGGDRMNVGRPKTPEDKKVQENGLFKWQWERIQAEAAAFPVPAAQYLRTILSNYFNAIDSTVESDAGVAEIDPALFEEQEKGHLKAQE